MTGDEEACRRYSLTGIEMAAIGGVGSIVTLQRGALAVLEQTLGNYERALELHTACAADEEQKGLGNPLVTRTPIGMIECAAQLGRNEIGERYRSVSSSPHTFERSDPPGVRRVRARAAGGR